MGGRAGGRPVGLTARSCSIAMLRFLVPLPCAVVWSLTPCLLLILFPVWCNLCRCLQATRQMWMW
jgi:hypothetical protein